MPPQKGRQINMGANLIMVSSITHAIKGRDLLKNKGFKAAIEKTPGKLDSAGCGYSISVTSNPEAALKIINAAGIKVLGTYQRQ